jgi:hypothetical protein
MAKYKIHDIRISFDAPPLDSAESLTVEKKKKFEANFQWLKFAIFFSDKKMNWYEYLTPLYPWGKKVDGGQELFAADDLGHVNENDEVAIPIESVESEFAKYLSKPELFPKIPGVPIFYINANKGDKKEGHKYSAQDFMMSFVKSGRYVLLTKDRRFVDPMGKELGVKGQPAEEEKTSDVNRQAIKNAKEKDYFTGGFDIMKKLVKKQHKHQDIKKK